MAATENDLGTKAVVDVVGSNVVDDDDDAVDGPTVNAVAVGTVPDASSVMPAHDTVIVRRIVVTRTVLTRHVPRTSVSSGSIALNSRWPERDEVLQPPDQLPCGCAIALGSINSSYCSAVTLPDSRAAVRRSRPS